MKNRLAELLAEAEGQINNDLPTVEQMAEYLIDHGVIVPPCKVGDAVYIVGVITEQKVCDSVQAITYDGSNFFLDIRAGVVYASQQIGKTVFLTKEEAEKVLAERNNR